MDHTYWHKQTNETPLFNDLLWSRPENKAQAGKLLIIGGNLHGFAAPAEAYVAAEKAGIGTARVLLPDALKKTVGKMLEHGIYTPSTPSGSFAKQSLADMLEESAWADGILLAGNLGRNSETAVVIESFLQDFTGQISLVHDAVDYVIASSAVLQQRQETTLIITIAQLQHLLVELKWPQAVTFDIPLLQLVDLLHEVTELFPFNIITKQQAQLLVAVEGQVSSTKLDKDFENWCIEYASRAAVWWLQNRNNVFEALTSSLLNIK